MRSRDTETTVLFFCENRAKAVVVHNATENTQDREEGQGF